MAKSTAGRGANDIAPRKNDRPAAAGPEAKAARQPSIVEGEGGFYWRDSETEALVGPFSSRKAAMADRDSPGPADDDPDDLAGMAGADAVHEAEAEIGIEDFIDPDTGEPTHGYEPHVRDDH
jgi:hypothetical protein